MKKDKRMQGFFEVELSQHSPLLHYQGMQSGAFLSDAALKAAVDEQMDNLLDGNRKKITYSLYSQLSGNIERELYENRMGKNKLYFGDTGIKNQSIKTYMIYTHKPIKLFISDYHYDEVSCSFQDCFVENLKSALAFNNFGKRGNKGFGCFWLNNEETLENYLKNLQIPLYKFSVKLNRNTNVWTLYKECYDQIDLVYKRLKSGINIPEKFYTKSLLFQYLNSNGLQWDKKSLKDIILSGKKYPNPKMYRFRLGYAQEHIYKADKGEHTGQAHKAFTVKYTITEKEKNDTNIKRIPSPIMFKIVYKDINEADILIFVHQWVKSDEYKRLDDIQIIATTDYNMHHYNIKFDMDNYDIEDFLNFALITNWKTGLPTTSKDPNAKKLCNIKISKV